MDDVAVGHIELVEDPHFKMSFRAPAQHGKFFPVWPKRLAQRLRVRSEICSPSWLVFRFIATVGCVDTLDSLSEVEFTELFAFTQLLSSAPTSLVRAARRGWSHFAMLWPEWSTSVVPAHLPICAHSGAGSCLLRSHVFGVV
jgi:hypothetical protein